MTVKTDISRFHIHDELTAPDASTPIIKGVATAGGPVSKFLGVLAGAPAALRAFAKMRSELRGGNLPPQTRERIALAVAEHRGDSYGIAQHARTARAVGLGLDEIAAARSFSSRDEREAGLLTFLRSVLDSDGPPDHHLLEEARELGWTDEEILEAIAQLALGEYQSMVANAAALPHDQIDPSTLPKAA